MLGKAIANAMRASADDSECTLTIGTRVEILGESYGDNAVVIDFETNMLGIPLVIVKTDDYPDLCFYKHELRPLS